MDALDEDRFTLPDLAKMQLVDCEQCIFARAWVPNDHHGALGRVRPCVFQYQGTSIVGAQYDGECPTEARKLLKSHVQRLSFEAELPCQGDKRLGIRLARWEGKASPQLIDARIHSETRSHRSQRAKRGRDGRFRALFSRPYCIFCILHSANKFGWTSN